jgi:hypothetical protein
MGASQRPTRRNSSGLRHGEANRTRSLVHQQLVDTSRLPNYLANLLRASTNSRILNGPRSASSDSLANRLIDHLVDCSIATLHSHNTLGEMHSQCVARGSATAASGRQRQAFTLVNRARDRSRLAPVPRRSCLRRRLEIAADAVARVH